MTDTKPDIFRRVTSGVAEDVFNQSIVDTVADVRFDSNNKNQSGKPVIRNFDYYNDTYKLDLPDVPFSAYGQGEKLLSFFGPTYQDARNELCETTHPQFCGGDVSLDPTACFDQLKKNERVEG